MPLSEYTQKNLIKKTFVKILKDIQKDVSKLEIKLVSYLIILENYHFVYAKEHLFFLTQLGEDALTNSDLLEKPADDLYNKLFRSGYKKLKSLSFDLSSEEYCQDFDFNNIILIPPIHTNPWANLREVFIKRSTIAIKNATKYTCPLGSGNHYHTFIPKFIAVTSKRNMLSYRRSFKVHESCFDTEFIKECYFINDKPIITSVEQSFMGHGYTSETTLPNDGNAIIKWIKYKMSNDDWLIGPKYFWVNK